MQTWCFHLAMHVVKSVPKSARILQVFDKTSDFAIKIIAQLHPVCFFSLWMRMCTQRTFAQVRLYFKRITGDLLTHIHGDILMNYCGGEVTGCSGSLVCSDKFYQQRAESMHPCPLYFCLFVNIQRLTLWSLVIQRQTPIDLIQTFVGLSNYLHAFSRHSFSADASFH